MSWLTLLWMTWKSRLILWGSLVGAALFFLLVVWLKGYRYANRRFQEKQQKARARQAESRRRINDSVRKSADDELDRRLSRWMRD